MINKEMLADESIQMYSSGFPLSGSMRIECIMAGCHATAMQRRAFARCSGAWSW